MGAVTSQSDSSSPSRPICHALVLICDSFSKRPAGQSQVLSIEDRCQRFEKFQQIEAFLDNNIDKQVLSSWSKRSSSPYTVRLYVGNSGNPITDCIVHSDTFLRTTRHEVQM